MTDFKYIVASTPEDLLGKVIDYVQSLKGKGEDLSISYTVDYSENGQWSLKLRITKTPRVTDLTGIVGDDVVKALPEADETGMKTIDTTIDLPVEDKGSFLYTDKELLDKQLEENLHLKDYDIAGEQEKAFSLVSAVGKYISRVSLPVKIAGRVAHDEVRAFALLLTAKVQSHIKKEATKRGQEKDVVDTVIERLFPDAIIHQETVTDSADEDLFVGDLDLHPVGVTEESAGSNLFDDLLLVSDGVIDLREVKATVQDVHEEKAIKKHVVATAFENTFPFVKEARYDEESHILEMKLGDDTRIKWVVDYDEKTQKVNAGKLMEAMKKTVSVKFTPFAEEDTPMWRIEEKEGRLVLIPAQ